MKKSDFDKLNKLRDKVVSIREKIKEYEVELADKLAYRFSFIMGKIYEKVNVKCDWECDYELAVCDICRGKDYIEVFDNNLNIEMGDIVRYGECKIPLSWIFGDFEKELAKLEVRNDRLSILAYELTMEEIEKIIEIKKDQSRMILDK